MKPMHVSLFGITKRYGIAVLSAAALSLAAGSAGAADSLSKRQPDGAFKTTKAVNLPHGNADKTLPRDTGARSAPSSDPIQKTKMGSLPATAAPHTLPDAGTIRYGSARVGRVPLYGPNMIDR